MWCFTVIFLVKLKWDVLSAYQAKEKAYIKNLNYILIVYDVSLLKFSALYLIELCMYSSL